jgi:hypothetical protein
VSDDGIADSKHQVGETRHEVWGPGRGGSGTLHPRLPVADVFGHVRRCVCSGAPCRRMMLGGIDIEIKETLRGAQLSGGMENEPGSGKGLEKQELVMS